MGPQVHFFFLFPTLLSFKLNIRRSIKWFSSQFCLSCAPLYFHSNSFFAVVFNVCKCNWWQFILEVDNWSKLLIKITNQIWPLTKWNIFLPPWPINLSYSRVAGGLCWVKTINNQLPSSIRWRGSNSRPLSWEPSDLTTSPWSLAIIIIIIIKLAWPNSFLKFFHPWICINLQKMLIF